MAAERAVLIAIIILALAVSPLAVPLLGGSSPGDATAYAALIGGGRAERGQQPITSPGGDDDGNRNNDDGIANNEPDDDGDDDDNDNNNDGGGDDDDNDNDNNGDGGDGDNDNDGGDDDNDNDGDGGDDNDNDDDDDDNGNDNVVVRHVRDRRPNESVNRPTKCFDNREVGVIQLGTGGYDVTVTVMPHSSFGQTTRMTLRSLDTISVPAVPGSLVGNVVFSLDAQSDCTGVAIGTLPNNVNMGITYNVVPAVDKSRLQIVRLEGGSWVNVDTVPDPTPGNPYVSTTINRAGTYALIQR